MRGGGGGGYPTSPRGGVVCRSLPVPSSRRRSVDPPPTLRHTNAVLFAAAAAGYVEEKQLTFIPTSFVCLFPAVGTLTSAEILAQIKEEKPFFCHSVWVRSAKTTTTTNFHTQQQRNAAISLRKSWQ
ncbi:hypothetical protein niasHS_009176 [Heterodera schachtii]|uniref:Uncharacterized protein n=1 Tax=Heterodera schachtii TaxID=97005 RepID=A0ABD2JEA9_HETSC